MSLNRCVCLFLFLCLNGSIMAQQSGSAVKNGNALPAAGEIIQKYMNAVGGEAELKKINSLFKSGQMTMKNIKVDIIKKDMNPNYSLTLLTMNSQVIVKQLYDGKSGYRIQMGKTDTMSTEELTEHKNTLGIFPQMYYSNNTYKLTLPAQEKLNGTDVYKILVETPTGSINKEYYDVASGYLLRSESNSKYLGQDLQQVIDYSNYKKVGNIYLPFTANMVITLPAGSQERLIEYTQIKLNEGVSPDDFK